MSQTKAESSRAIIVDPKRRAGTLKTDRHESQMPHSKPFFVADESDPKRFRGRVGTVVRRCTRTEPTQKIITFFTSLGFIGLMIVLALDHRFVWSRMPPYVALTGDVLVALGFLAIFFVFKENTFLRTNPIPVDSVAGPCLNGLCV
jgi:hypothetical protein